MKRLKSNLASINYDQDAEMRNGKNRPYFTRIENLVPQQEDAQVIAHSTLVPGSLPQIQAASAFDQTIQSSTSSFVQIPAPKPIQICLPNSPSPSVFNQNSTTEQQPTSSRYGLHPRPGECELTSWGYFILFILKSFKPNLLYGLKDGDLINNNHNRISSRWDRPEQFMHATNIRVDL